MMTMYRFLVAASCLALANAGDLHLRTRKLQSVAPTEIDDCPLPGDGGCAAIFDPVECGDNKCEYSSQCLAILAGFPPEECGKAEMEEIDATAVPDDGDGATTVDVEDDETMSPIEGEIEVVMVPSLNDTMVEIEDDETMSPVEGEIEVLMVPSLNETIVDIEDAETMAPTDGEIEVVTHNDTYAPEDDLMDDDVVGEIDGVADDDNTAMEEAAVLAEEKEEANTVAPTEEEEQEIVNTTTAPTEPPAEAETLIEDIETAAPTAEEGIDVGLEIVSATTVIPTEPPAEVETLIEDTETAVPTVEEGIDVGGGENTTTKAPMEGAGEEGAETEVPTEEALMAIPEAFDVTMPPTVAATGFEEIITVDTEEEDFEFETGSATPTEGEAVEITEDEEGVEALEPPMGENMTTSENTTTTEQGDSTGNELQGVPPAGEELEKVCSPDVLASDDGGAILQCEMLCLIASCCWNTNDPVQCLGDKNCAGYQMPCGTHLVAAMGASDETQKHPSLSNAECTVESPCSACQGDCNTDDDCDVGLECFRRTGNEMREIPGCAGKGVPGQDYCWAPQDGVLVVRDTQCSPGSPCTPCQGDCDKDADCEGDFACYQTREDTPTTITGCEGVVDNGLDFCYKPVVCGPTICDQGLVCCNESCGICTPPDDACTQQVCAAVERSSREGSFFARGDFDLVRRRLSLGWNNYYFA